MLKLIIGIIKVLDRVVGSSSIDHRTKIKDFTDLSVDQI
jgi:hypothetical protein